jgi:subtilisin
MKPLWRSDDRREQFPGVPAWGAPASRIAPLEFPVIGLGEISPEWAWGGADGAGVRVCVVDTGIHAAHPLVGHVDQSMTVDLSGREPRIKPVEATDPAGHGTACAGIIRSLAPMASISSMRVLTDSIGGTGNALIAGLEWAISEGFDVINMSLSTTRPEFCLALYELADKAYFRRTTLVVSAHNMPVRSFPWPYASVISVASHDQPEPFLHYYNPKPPVEFHARGVRVPVAWPNGGQVRSTGNSYAAPHITGICALILGKHPWLTPFQLKTVLYLTAHNVRTAAGDGHANA